MACDSVSQSVFCACPPWIHPSIETRLTCFWGRFSLCACLDCREGERGRVTCFTGTNTKFGKATNIQANGFPVQPNRPPPLPPPKKATAINKTLDREKDWKNQKSVCWVRFVIKWQQSVSVSANHWTVSSLSVFFGVFFQQFLFYYLTSPNRHQPRYEPPSFVPTPHTRASQKTVEPSGWPLTSQQATHLFREQPSTIWLTSYQRTKAVRFKIVSSAVCVCSVWFLNPDQEKKDSFSETLFFVPNFCCCSTLWIPTLCTHPHHHHHHRSSISIS